MLSIHLALLEPTLSIPKAYQRSPIVQGAWFYARTLAFMSMNSLDGPQFSFSTRDLGSELKMEASQAHEHESARVTAERSEAAGIALK